MDSRLLWATPESTCRAANDTFKAFSVPMFTPRIHRKTSRQNTGRYFMVSKRLHDTSDKLTNCGMAVKFETQCHAKWLEALLGQTVNGTELLADADPHSWCLAGNDPLLSRTGPSQIDAIEALLAKETLVMSSAIRGERKLSLVSNFPVDSGTRQEKGNALWGERCLMSNPESSVPRSTGCVSRSCQ